MGKKKKGSFKQRWGTLTEIGQLFSVSAVKVGAQLKTMGLRHPDGKPTAEALAQNLVHVGTRAGGFEFFLWDKQALPERLRRSGWKQVAGPADKAFEVAQRALKLAREGDRWSAKNQDKAAVLTYQAAQLEIADVVAAAKPVKRPALALRIAEHLAKGGMEMADVQSFMEGCGVSWAELEALKLGRCLQPASMNVDATVSRPRL